MKRRGFTLEGHSLIPDVLGAIDQKYEGISKDFASSAACSRKCSATKFAHCTRRSSRNSKRRSRVIERAIPPSGFTEILRQQRVVMAAEAARYHGERLCRHPDDYPPNVRALLEEGLSHPATRCTTRLATVSYRLADQMDRALGTRVFVTPGDNEPSAKCGDDRRPGFQRVRGVSPGNPRFLSRMLSRSMVFR